MNTSMVFVSFFLCVSFTNAAIYRPYADDSPELLMQTDVRVGKETDGVGSSNDDSTVVSRKRRSIFTDIAERLAEVVSKFSAFQEPREVGINSHAFDTNSLKRGNPLDEKIRKESNIVYKKVTDGENGKESDAAKKPSQKSKIDGYSKEKANSIMKELYQDYYMMNDREKDKTLEVIMPLHPETKQFLHEQLEILKQTKSALIERRERILKKYLLFDNLKNDVKILIDRIFWAPFGEDTKGYLEMLTRSMPYETKLNVISDVLDVQKGFIDFYKEGPELIKKVQSELSENEFDNLEKKIFAIYDHSPRPFPTSEEKKSVVQTTVKMKTTS